MFNVDKDYFKDKAKEQLDDALTTLVSDQGLSTDEIYDMLVGAVEELYEYFNKQTVVCKDLLNKISRQQTKKVEDRVVNITYSDEYKAWIEQQKRYLPNPESNKTTECQLEAAEAVDKDIKEERSIRFISSAAYDVVGKALGEGIDLDVRQFSFSDKLYDSSGLDLIKGDLVAVWNNYIVSGIIECVNEKVKKLYGPLVRSAEELGTYKSNHGIRYLDGNKDAVVFGETLYDLLVYVDAWLDYHFLNVLRAERLVQEHILKTPVPINEKALTFNKSRAVRETALHNLEQAIEEIEEKKAKVLD